MLEGHMPQGLGVQVPPCAPPQTKVPTDKAGITHPALFLTREVRGNLLPRDGDLKAGALFCEQGRAKSRGGVAAEPMERGESRGQVPPCAPPQAKVPTDRRGLHTPLF